MDDKVDRKNNAKKSKRSKRADAAIYQPGAFRKKKLNNVSNDSVSGDQQETNEKSFPKAEYNDETSKTIDILSDPKKNTETGNGKIHQDHISSNQSNYNKKKQTDFNRNNKISCGNKSTCSEKQLENNSSEPVDIHINMKNTQNHKIAEKEKSLLHSSHEKQSYTSKKVDAKNFSNGKKVLRQNKARSNENTTKPNFDKTKLNSEVPSSTVIRRHSDTIIETAEVKPKNIQSNTFSDSNGAKNNTSNNSECISQQQRNSSKSVLKIVDVPRNKGRGRGRGHKNDNVESKMNNSMQKLTITNSNYKNSKNYYDDRLYNPNDEVMPKSTNIPEVKPLVSFSPTVTYHVEAKLNKEDSLLNKKKLDLEEQLGEKIQPIVFINPSDDEDELPELKKKASPNSAIKSIQQISNEDSRYNSNNTKNIYPEYEQNLQNFLNQKRSSNQVTGKNNSSLTFDTHNVNSSRPHHRGLVYPSNDISSPPVATKQLFNPSDPSKPLIVPISSRDSAHINNGNSSASAPVQQYEDDFDELSMSVDSNNSLSSSKGFDEILHNIQRGECDIQYFVNSNQIPREFSRIMDIRDYLQNCYISIFTTDITMCHQKNIEAQMWKALYYQIIEKLREYIARVPELREKSVSTLLLLVQEGHKFLQSLIRAIEHSYGFSIANIIHSVAGDGEHLRGRSKLALGTIQRLMLDLGDLARYRYLYTPPVKMPYHALPPYRWYTLASKLYPRNGRPFHQLAILSVTQKRPLDVFYYYVRSLMAANPFISAKDSLTSFFEGIRTRYTHLQAELGMSGEDQRAAERERTDLEEVIVRGSGLHKEVWVRPDGDETRINTMSHSQLEDQPDPVTQLRDSTKPDQLMKQFLTCFLHCHGLLFSRVSLEHFHQCCERTLLLYAALLSSSPPRLSATHLAQIHALNMFSVSATQLHDTSLGQGYRSHAQELALILSQEMFGRLAQHVASVLPHSINSLPKYYTSTPLNSTTNTTTQSPSPDDSSPYPPRSPVGTDRPEVSTTPSSAVSSLPSPSVANSTYNSSSLSSPTASEDAFDIIGMTWLLDEVDVDHTGIVKDAGAASPPSTPGSKDDEGSPTNYKKVDQLPRLLLPGAAHCIPALKVWCDWLLYSSTVWNPPPHCTDYNTPGYDCWSAVAELATLIRGGFSAPDVPLVSCPDSTAGLYPLLLEEDRYLKGFEPLLTAQDVPPMYTSDPAAVARGCDWVRVQQLHTVLCKILCGLDPPVLKLHKTPQGEVLIPALPSSTPSAEDTPPVTPTNEDEDFETFTCSSDDDTELLLNEGASSEVLRPTITMLWHRKKELDRHKKQQRKMKRQAESVFTVELEVRPKYIIADTNCYIDHLQFLTELTTPPSPYMLLVPLVVVGELEGLSKCGPGTNDSPATDAAAAAAHAASRAMSAIEARNFMRSSQYNVRAVTTQGSIIRNCDFQEAATETMSNDDKILTSCTHFCELRPPSHEASEGSSRGVMKFLCEVVLLTRDRNLAIKAHSANVPVRTVQAFKKWVEAPMGATRDGTKSPVTTVEQDTASPENSKETKHKQWGRAGESRAQVNRGKFREKRGFAREHWGERQRSWSGEGREGQKMEENEWKDRRRKSPGQNRRSGRGSRSGSREGGFRRGGGGGWYNTGRRGRL